MVFPDARDTLAAVPPAAFHDPALGHIAATVTRLHTHGDHIDAATIANDLRHENLLDTVGGNDGILRLWNDTATVHGAAPEHARIVVDAWRDRQIAYHSLEIDRAVREGREWNTHLDAIVNLDTGNTTENTWAEIDLEPVVTAEQRTAPPEILHRDDGQALIYPGKIHAFNADSESGKSWLALWACVEEITAGRHVLYIDFEDGAESIVERLEDLGAPLGLLYGPDRLFHYVRPDDRSTPTAVARLADLGARVVVLDGVTEAMSLGGLSIKENDDIAVFLAALPRVFARAGSAVILIDHVVKKKSERGDDAIGGIHKRAGIDGASYMLDKIRPFGRGMDGAATIYVTKDRPGHIRPACVAGRTAGQLRLTSTAGKLALTVAAPESIVTDDGTFRPTVLMERISRAVEEANSAGTEPTTTAVLATVKGKNVNKTQALNRLITEGFVEVRHVGKSNLHVSLRPFREHDEPASRDHPTPTDDELEEAASWVNDAF